MIKSKLQSGLEKIGFLSFLLIFILSCNSISDQSQLINLPKGLLVKNIENMISQMYQTNNIRQFTKENSISAAGFTINNNTEYCMSPYFIRENHYIKKNTLILDQEIRNRSIPDMFHHQTLQIYAQDMMIACNEYHNTFSSYINYQEIKNIHHSDTTKFINGEFSEFFQWKDNAGNKINVSDGGMIFVNNKYYWYGLAVRPLGQSKDENNGAATTTGINLYSSIDLHHWDYEGVILHVSNNTTSPLRSPLRLERPKIIFNKKTKKFVMWFHYVGYPGAHGQSIGLADAGVAVADSINGEFKFLGYQRPIDSDGAVKDCSLFTDDDDNAYFIYDRKLKDGNRCIYVVKLSDDYLNPTNEWARIDAANRREAPIVIKNKGVYYMITSDLTGWEVNAAKTFKSKSIMGPWVEIGNPCVGEGIESTYNTQGSYAFSVQGVPDLFIVMLERHNPKNFFQSSYVWLPIEFSANDEIYFPYKKEWDIKSYLEQRQRK